jgi:thiol-disulfide isomerase/thioredoxin
MARSKKMMGLIIISFQLLMSGVLMANPLSVNAAQKINSFPKTHSDRAPVLNSLHIFIGHTTILIFVATSCKYCAYEGKNVLPNLVKWSKKQECNIVIVNASDTLGLAIAGKEPQLGKDGSWMANQNARKISIEMEKWAQLYHLGPDVYVNPSLILARKYNITKLPSGMVFNSRGKLLMKWVGEHPASEIERAILFTIKD